MAWWRRAWWGTRRAAVAALLGAAATSSTVSVRGATGPAPTTVAPPLSTTLPPSPPEPPPLTAEDRYRAAGLVTFRGSPSRTYYGRGPVPRSPRVLWRFPDQAMCSTSFDRGTTSEWCGTGWTGQPAVVERDGRTWVVFGAYDRYVHFLDAGTGGRILPGLATGDIIKGSVTFDPDGFPLVYTGSRDDNFRVLALDRPQPTELWRLPADAVQPVLWNNDWDGSALILDDYLIEGGENSQWHVVKLNRSYGPDGLVTVRPELVFHAPGWDDELLAALGDHEVSIENSVAVADGIAYFANSGGLVQGWDISGLAAGRMPTRVFRFWTGDDTDASVVVDDDGMLYVASEWQRHDARAAEVGQLMKLDPHRPDAPLVWSVPDRDGDLAGIWATPALYGDLVVTATNGGRLMGIDRRTGVVRWTKRLPGPTWQSPVVVDGVLIEGDCSGVLHGYDLSNTAIDPPELWSVELGGCIESTPAVWKGRLYVGTRSGTFFAVGDG